MEHEKQPEVTMVEDTAQCQVSEEIAEDQELRVTLRAFVFASVIAFGGWIINFDTTYSGNLLAMEAYNASFGSECKPGENGEGMVCQLTATQQSLTSISMIFGAIGSSLSGYISNRYGRRGVLTFGCVLSVIGAAGLVGTEGNFAAHLVCKCIAAFGTGALMANCNMYGVECTPSTRRGILIGLFNVGLASGNASAAGVCAGGSTIAGNWSWRLPIILQVPVGIFLGSVVWLFPDSPRWYVLRGNTEKARDAFAKFYGIDKDSSQAFKHVKAVEESIEFERAQAMTASWTEIFRGVDRRRQFASSILLVGVALSGINFVAGYAAVWFSEVGITSVFLNNAIVALCLLFGAIWGAFGLDYIGRRMSLLFGYSFMASCMLVISATSSALGANNPKAKNVLIAFTCIWATGFGGFVASASWVGTAEMHSVRLRSYGQAFTAFCYNIFNFASTFWTPYMINPEYGNWGTNVGYFYMGLEVFMFVMVFFFVPEPARLTLEEMDQHFASGEPTWKSSLKRNKEIARQRYSVK